MYLLTLTMEGGESHHILLDDPLETGTASSLSFFDVAEAVDEHWSPGDGDTLTVRELENDDITKRNLAIQAHVFTDHHDAERFLDAWGGRENNLIITTDDGAICRHDTTWWPVQTRHVEQLAQLATPFSEAEAGESPLDFQKRIAECS